MKGRALAGMCSGTLLASACGGHTAMMHPAHPLPAGSVSAGAGVSRHFVLGEADRAIADAAVAQNTTGAAQQADRTSVVFKGAAAQALLAPGVSPWLGARAGLGGSAEAGLAYSGRHLRADARRAFIDDNLAASVGLGLSGRLLEPQRTEEFGDCDPNLVECDGRVAGAVRSSGEIGGLEDRGLTGWGVDLPLLFGWRSNAELVALWAGARTGYQQLWGELLWQATASEGYAVRMEGDRISAGGVVGMMVSIGSLWAGVELEGGGCWVHARVSFPAAATSDAAATEDLKTRVAGVYLSPTAALGSRF